jgi:hypothetical protein
MPTIVLDGRIVLVVLVVSWVAAFLLGGATCSRIGGISMISDGMLRRLVELFVAAWLIGICVLSVSGCAAFRTDADPREFFAAKERWSGGV